MSLTFAYFTGPLLQALSQPRKLAILEWCRAAVSILFLCVIGLIVRDRPTSWHLVGIALARFVPSVFLVTPVFLGILMKLCRISMRDLVSAITPSVSASLGAVIAVSLVQYSGVSANSRPIIQLISEVTVGGAVGGAILVALDRQLRVFILATSQRMMRRPAFSR
jgi:hypothetical protein